MVVEVWGAIVAVVLVGAVVLVVVLAAVVEVDEVVVDVVGGVDGFGVTVGDGDGVKMFLTDGPLPAFPKISASGLPEMSSMAVMNNSAITNTTAAVPAMVVQRKVRGLPDPATFPDSRMGRVVASIRRGAGTSVTAEISRRSVPSADDAIPTSSAPGPGVTVDSVGAGDASPGAPSALVPVPPSLRSNGVDSGARTTTCLTACWPRSMDCATNAVPKVAAADPIATPTMVPLTPKLDAMIAAMTAPAAEAKIWRMENFTPGAPPRRPLRSLPHGAVDLLAQQVGVPVVTRVLLDHVHHDPAQGQGRLLGRFRERVEARCRGGDRS